MSTRVPPEAAKALAAAASGTRARTDVRQSTMLSTDEVSAATHDRRIPIEGLESPPPDIELMHLADTQHPDFALDAFMEEKVTIFVPMSNVEGDLQFVEPRVNGASVVIPRGRNVIVKRKFVEALAHAKQSAYEQSVVNIDQANIDTPLIEKVALSAGFTVVQDSERGRRWLQDLLQQAV